MANPNIKGGKKKGAGRPKGSKDKLPRALKDRVLAVWDKLRAEGKDLYDEASSDPKWYYQNFVKPMLPKDIDIKTDGESFSFTVVLDGVNDKKTK